MSSREKEIAQLRASLKEVVGAIQWCSGSPDFNDGGQFREGWLKVVVPAMHQAMAALSSSDPSPLEAVREAVRTADGMFTHGSAVHGTHGTIHKAAIAKLRAALGLGGER